MITTEVYLDDVDSNPATKTKIRFTDSAIEVDFVGFGSSCMEEGFGYPVMIEIRKGIPHVIIFADINDEEPTYVISLAGAAESNRKASHA